MVQNPNNPMQIGGKPRSSPDNVAATFGCYVMAGVRLTFWGVVAAAACGAAYVALRATWVAVQWMLTAIGA